MPQHLDFALREAALVRGKDEPSRVERAADVMDVAAVRIPVLAEDGNVVKIDNTGSVDERTQGVVHSPLKRRRSVGQAHRHVIPLEVTIATGESRVRLVSLLHWDLPELVEEFQASKVSRTSEQVQRVVSSWNRVSVFLRDGVECAIVYRDPPFAIGLGHDMDWSRPGGTTSPNGVVGQGLVQEVLDGTIIRRRLSAGRKANR